MTCFRERTRVKIGVFYGKKHALINSRERPLKSDINLEQSSHDVELVKIAGYMHDIGNTINRTHHAEYGALLANDLLKDTNMSLEDRITVISAMTSPPEARRISYPPRSSSRTRQMSGEAGCGRRSRRPLTFTTG